MNDWDGLADFERLRARHVDLERAFNHLRAQPIVNMRLHEVLRRRLAAHRHELRRWREHFGRRTTWTRSRELYPDVEAPEPATVAGGADR